jgi:hypothetical protein
VATGVLRDNIDILRQGLQLVTRLEAAAYCTPNEHGSAIGVHVRHVLEHYSAFLAGHESGLVDYEARPRDAAVENDRQTAISRIVETLEGLMRLRETDLGRALAVHDCTGVDACDDSPSASSARRELQFLHSHTIHHWALIALLLARNGIAVAPEFGIAPSTLRHWEEQRRCARRAG